MAWRDKLWAFGVGFALALGSAMPMAWADGPPIFVHVAGQNPPGYLPLSSAACPAPGSAAAPADRNPAVSWSAGPKGTEYYALIMADTGIAKDLTQKPGQAAAPHIRHLTFVHWLLANIPVGTTQVAAGADSDGFTPGGKPAAPSPIGLRGQNTYALVYAHHPGMQGPWAGYDGPCPARRNNVVQAYDVIVVAVDQELALSPGYSARDLLTAMNGHALSVGYTTVRFGFGISR